MKVHHLNCGTMCPLGGHWIDGASPGLRHAHLVCHCLLVETNAGLVLVDTGFGLQDVLHPTSRLSPLFVIANGIRFAAEATAIRQIEALDFKPDDVRHIVLTHLDCDHAGGLTDFPNAQVHVMRDEYQAAVLVHSPRNVLRYRSQQWPQPKLWNQYGPQGEAWFGFDAVRDLQGLPPEILMVPLAGHTLGHAGIAVSTKDGWLLHAGDAYFYRGEMDVAHPHCTLGLQVFQRLIEVDHENRLHNQKRLLELKRNHGDKVKLFCAHDHVELTEAQASG